MNAHEAAETYRSLHATIKFAAGTSPVRSVLIVDVGQKSVSPVAANVAAAFAAAGDSCALVDADFRSPATVDTGLSDLIRDPGTAVTIVDDEVGPARIPPGTGADPAILSSGGLVEALKSLRSRYDYLVVSCPPLPEYSDAVALASQVDATILVISAGITGRDEAIRARDALQRVGARILGMVLIERPRRWF